MYRRANCRSQRLRPGLKQVLSNIIGVDHCDNHSYCETGIYVAMEKPDTRITYSTTTSRFAGMLGRELSPRATIWKIWPYSYKPTQKHEEGGEACIKMRRMRVRTCIAVVYFHSLPSISIYKGSCLGHTLLDREQNCLLSRLCTTMESYVASPRIDLLPESLPSRRRAGLGWLVDCYVS
jgi:hypothetical protein